MASKELLKLATAKIAYDANQTCDRICDAINSLDPEMQEFNTKTPKEILQDALKHAQEVERWLRAMKDE
jgi:hypothetical protein